MHKWAKEITHFVNGGKVECRWDKSWDDKWYLVDDLEEFGADENIFRIKPTKKTMKVVVCDDGYGRTCLRSPDDIPLWVTRLSDIIEIEYEEPQS